jgi:hypothetical protein
MERQVKFKREKVTKNTVRFREVEVKGQPPCIDTLYVQKWLAGDAEEIAVTLHFPGEEQK